jgi:arginine decarboxylase
MLIHVSAGTGSGPTKLAAFDLALQSAGVANYNLIRLSSIVPPNSKIISHQGAVPKLPGNWGDRLYVVMADHRVDTPNAEAWAGIGWVQNEQKGEGLFVEHESASESTVKLDIEQSLHSLMASRKMEFGPINMKISGITCLNSPVCALVIATFQSSNWKEAIMNKVPSLNK